MPTTNPSDIHDTATCACEQCCWANQQEEQMIMAERDESKCADIDLVLEQVITVNDADIVRQLTTPRDFSSVMNEWLDMLLDLNQGASIAEMVMINRLGFAAQRLLYEAHALGLNEGLKIATRMMKERCDG